MSWDELRRAWPEHYYTHHCKTYDIFALIEYAESIPVSILPISNFEHELTSVPWEDEKAEVKIVLEKLIEELKIGAHFDLEDFREEHKDDPLYFHFANILHVNPEYPIWILEEEKFPSAIIDGFHRFCKAILVGKSEIPVRVFKNIPEFAIVNKKINFEPLELI